MGRVQLRTFCHKALPPKVSILTRPVGRVQRQKWFDVVCRHQACFNPHPARGPSATGDDHGHDDADEGVSILTRPVGRVQRRDGPTGCRTDRRFQSSPGPWAECNSRCIEMMSSSFRFQSSPGPWAECNGALLRLRAPRPVSILTRPVGRVQLALHYMASKTLVLFQSSPGPWAECNWRCTTWPARRWCCFNPHPARGPSATYPVCPRNIARTVVSILTRPVGRVQHSLISQTSQVIHLVSILTRPVGRVQHWCTQRGHQRHQHVSILTRPVGRVQLPCCRLSLVGSLFQSSPGPWAECNCPGLSRRSAPRCFNPHPARGPSATSGARRTHRQLRHVSILTRPVGRVQLPYPFFLLVHREPPQPWQGVSTFCSI